MKTVELKDRQPASAAPTRAARGAREVEAVARNPACFIPALAVADGLSLDAAAQALNLPAEGATNEAAQSPHALRHGIRFEKRALRDEAAAIVDLYQDHGILGADAVVHDLTAPEGVSPAHARAAVMQATALAIADRAAGRPAPDMIVQGAITLRQLGGITLMPDVLVAAAGSPFYFPADLKSFPDLGGRTDTSALRSGRRQLAVYWLALMQATDAVADIDPHGDLILSAAGSQTPSLCREKLTGEVQTMGEVLDGVDERADRLRAVLAASGHANVDTPQALSAARPAWRPSCAEHCSLHRACEYMARAAGDPVTVDERAPAQLGPIGDLRLYEQLIDGDGDGDLEQQAIVDDHRALLDIFERTTR